MQSGNVLDTPQFGHTVGSWIAVDALLKPMMNDDVGNTTVTTRYIQCEGSDG